MELAKTWRNRLRRINQKAGGTEGKFLALMKEVVKCKTHDEFRNLRMRYRDNPDFGCLSFEPTQDHRTQVPRWYPNGMSDTDLCKKVYLNIELIALFGTFIENRPSDVNIHPHLKDSMVYRKYCSEKKPGQQRGCFNILHLGIAISDTEFTNRLQEALSPPDQCIQEFRDWAKNLYRNLAMTRGSSPEEFLDLVKRQDYKLIQVFKKLLRTEDTADPREEMSQPDCCFLKYGSTDHEKNSKTIGTIREGVVRFACNLDQIDPNNRGLKNHAWNACDKNNAKLPSTFKFCVNPNHASITQNREYTSRMLKDFKKAGRKIKNHLIHSTSHNGVSGTTVDCGHYPAPAIDRFAEINYYRYHDPQGLDRDGNVQPAHHDYFSCEFTNVKEFHNTHQLLKVHEKNKNKVERWYDSDVTPMVRVKVKPTSTIPHMNTNKERIHPVTKQSFINNRASFNLYHRQPKDDEHKCRKLLAAGDESHRKCTDNNGGRCKVSYTNQIGLMPAAWFDRYKFNVCLDSINDSPTDEGKEDVVISVENTGTENIYVSLSTFDLKELDCEAWKKHLKSDCPERTFFKKLPPKQRMECLRFDQGIREKLDQLFAQSSSQQGAKDIYQYLSRVYVLFQWNRDPVTKKALLEFTEFEPALPRQQLENIGLPADVDLVVLDKKCSIDRTEFLDIRSFHIHQYIELLRTRTSSTLPTSG